MVATSFAEILREKIEKNNSSKSSPTSSFTASTSSDYEPKQVARLHQCLLEQAPNAYSVSLPKVGATPYRRFQSPHQHTPYPHDWAKKAHSQGNTTPKASAPAAPRAKGPPHKLSDKHALSMAYFINEKMFLLEDFTLDELKRAYRLLALTKHPDRREGNSQHFVELKKHYEMLKTVFNK